MGAYLTLFAGAFLAATFLPLSSELAVAGVLAAGYPAAPVLGVATLGNTLGAALNWLIGRYLEHFRGRRWFPVDARQLERAQRWFQHYGVWSLLLAWLPVAGDALTFIAGIMRVRFELFLLLTALGKGARYAAVIYGLDLVRGG